MEKLKKVNSFSELKVGQIVVVKGCRVCGASKCRKILMKLDKALVHYNDPSDATLENTWFGLPNCETPAWGLQPGCTARSVSEGRLYLVVDGMEDVGTVEKRKKLETVK
jgi:hypothetical protein